MPKISAGIILYRIIDLHFEVLLGHMGGPFWTKKDEAGWTMPKGEFDPSREDPLQAAIREFREETGVLISGPFLDLGIIRQSGGKQVYAWACKGDVDPSTLVSNSFAMEWPPRSGKLQDFPELDRFAWFGLGEAKTKIIKGQQILLEKLVQALRS